MKACWFDGQMIDPDEAGVSVFDHGLLYGDGVFEGIRFYDGVPFRLEAHLRRLQRSARALHLDLPYSGDDLDAATLQTALVTGEPDGYLRLVVTRGVGTLGVDPRTCSRATVFIVADRLQIASDEARRAGASLIVSATRRLSVDELDPRIKSLNYLNQILARLEANQSRRRRRGRHPQPRRLWRRRYCGQPVHRRRRRTFDSASRRRSAGRHHHVRSSWNWPSGTVSPAVSRALPSTTCSTPTSASSPARGRS